MSASVGEDLAGALNDSSICKSHSLKKTVPYMINTFPKDDKNMCEVELTLDGFFPVKKPLKLLSLKIAIVSWLP